MATTIPTPTTEPDCGCGPAIEAPAKADLPTAKLLTTIDDTPLYDSAGRRHTFRSVYASEDADKHLIIFVRHWFCGNCQEYIRSLSHQLPQSSLPPRTKITIIGHGAHELIGNYASVTGWNEADMYTNTDKHLFKALELGSSKAMGEKPKYIKQSLLGTTIAGIMQGLSSGRNALKGGDFWQVGGEFLFVKDGEEWKVTWAHRMKTTRDHAEVDELLKVLGIDATETKPRGARDIKTEIAGIKAWVGSKGKIERAAPATMNGTNVEKKGETEDVTPATTNGTPVENKEKTESATPAKKSGTDVEKKLAVLAN